jgi:imidazolonepropionase-like amidohydrolase
VLPQVRRGLLSASPPVTPEKGRRIPIVAGTDDVVPGFDPIRETRAVRESRLSPAAALQAATIGPARVMKMDAVLGSIEPAKIAGARHRDANPLADTSQLRRVQTTIKGGVLSDSRALYASAGVKARAIAG